MIDYVSQYEVAGAALAEAEANLPKLEAAARIQPTCDNWAERERAKKAVDACKLKISQRKKELALLKRHVDVDENENEPETRVEPPAPQGSEKEDQIPFCCQEQFRDIEDRVVEATRALPAIRDRAAAAVEAYERDQNAATLREKREAADALTIGTDRQQKAIRVRDRYLQWVKLPETLVRVEQLNATADTVDQVRGRMKTVLDRTAELMVELAKIPAQVQTLRSEIEAARRSHASRAKDLGLPPSPFVPEEDAETTLQEAASRGATAGGMSARDLSRWLFHKWDR